MSNTKAYTYYIGPQSNPQESASPTVSGSLSGAAAGAAIGVGSREIGLISQTSPTWVLTFVRWQYRDTLRTPTSAPSSVRDPLIVQSDCISVTTTFNKNTLTHNMTALLLETDTNYADAIHPGDFVFVNILNWESDAEDVAIKASKQLPINEQDDGFKGFYKIQGVRKLAIVDPQTGIKTVAIKIDGFAFTEFNNTIYFNPNLILPKLLGNQALFINNISAAWSQLISMAGKPYLQEILAFLIQSLIGSGVNPQAQQANGLVVSPNIHFQMPILVSRLLGLTVNPTIPALNATSSATIAAKDVYKYLFGIQQYSSGANQKLQTGMNPSNLEKSQRYPNFHYTTQPCPGNTILKPEYWNQVTLWSILNQYTNAPINELFSSLKIDHDTGRVLPTIVFRQIPFTSEDFASQILGVGFNGSEIKSSTGSIPSGSFPVTQFLTLPRWKIGSESVFNTDLGTDEAARVNFVQYYAKSTFDKQGTDISNETASGNYIFDQKDVNRSGLRPIVVQNQFEDLPINTTKYAKIWAYIYGDAVIGGHLKINGTIESIGIVEPIAIGDNLEFDNTVFHIEQITHNASINRSNGMKTFRTTLSLSHGVNVNSSAVGTVYSQMNYPDAYQDRAVDYQNEQILPGVSDSQDTTNRPNNVDQPHLQDVAFPQPNTIPNRNGGGNNNG